MGGLMIDNKTIYLILVSKLRLSLVKYTKEDFERKDREYIKDSFMCSLINYYIGSYIKNNKSAPSILKIIKNADEDFIDYLIIELEKDKGLVYLFLTTIIDYSDMDNIMNCDNYKKMCKHFRPEMVKITEGSS